MRFGTLGPFVLGPFVLAVLLLSAAVRPLAAGLENGENSISENLDFKIFWGGMPPDPPGKLAPLALEK